MNYRSYLAELLGTFTLTFVVWLTAAFTMPLATPIIAAITLGIFVYTIGGISGAHLNPAVTLGLLSVNKIKGKDAAMYVLAQFLGATLAMLLGANLSAGVEVGTENLLIEGVGETIGAFLFVFGIASVVYKHTPVDAKGLVIGASLLLGVFVAFPMSNGILNPAVAWGVGSFNPMYILGPIIGAVGGCWAFKTLAKEK